MIAVRECAGSSREFPALPAALFVARGNLFVPRVLGWITKWNREFPEGYIV